MITKENINKIWEYIKNQNQISAKIFYLYFVLEMTFKDISKELNLKESTVKTNLYRMVKKVKEAFGGERFE
ncbi:MAG: RNA polymerase sigma factor [Clostridia bacterium]